MDEHAERERLHAEYAAMPDEQLLELAADRDELTDEAQAALAAELARRQLATPEVATGYDKVEERPLAKAARFRDLPAALLAKGSLESAGIESVLFNENMVRMDWFYSNLVGGIVLQVAPEDLEAAREILTQPPDNFEPDTGGAFTQPECPNCHSREVDSPGQDTGARAALLWATTIPLPFENRDWKCEDCGHRWREPATPTDV
ncbi:MAG: DUF2007 domain-containing protein [Candidatus Koribacter versatilis]|uniref:DUF2007 domain-containing protein n=1 Tax=Candidatus Korobacter versatilis TaxID=658062 RepID=A0A932A953_9BACT|nr:DUF2007 domain-containing protein [Candidatus Koribacter versatilis]